MRRHVLFNKCTSTIVIKFFIFLKKNLTRKWKFKKKNCEEIIINFKKNKKNSKFQEFFIYGRSQRTWKNFKNSQ